MALLRDLQDKFAEARKAAEEGDAKRRAAQNNLPYLNLISTKVPTEIKAMELVPENEARKALLAPLQIFKKKLAVAVFDPNKPETKAVIERLKKTYEVSVAVSSISGLNHFLEFYKYIVEQKEISGRVQIDQSTLKELVESVATLGDLETKVKNFKSPYTSKILEVILGGSLPLRASDIHLEPADRTNSLRLRIDGLLHTVYDGFTSLVYKSLITRIKLLSNLKLNIANEPQDGRFTIKLGERSIEMRTSIIPSEYGETVVMRILDPQALKVNLEDLGWRSDDLDIIRKEITKPNGLILNTGPTGSGKTTTLYAFLRSVVRPEIKIITIEDPIEYHLPGISQTQVDPEANYTFASGLRSILRQDPDIVLVGEIRDKETAEIALNASLTGHLVLSTLHTNDAVGAIPRLIDLGAKLQILGSGLDLVIAQRLVRILCPVCKQAKKIDGKTDKNIKDFISSLPKRVNRELFKEIKIFEPKGCKDCAGIGYKERTSIFELFVVGNAIEQAIYKNPNEIELKGLAKSQEMVTMQEDGVIKMLQGLTSLAEVERLTGTVSLFQ